MMWCTVDMLHNCAGSPTRHPTPPGTCFIQTDFAYLLQSLSALYQVRHASPCTHGSNIPAASEGAGNWKKLPDVPLAAPPNPPVTGVPNAGEGPAEAAAAGAPKANNGGLLPLSPAPPLLDPAPKENAGGVLPAAAAPPLLLLPAFALLPTPNVTTGELLLLGPAAPLLGTPKVNAGLEPAAGAVLLPVPPAAAVLLVVPKEKAAGLPVLAAGPEPSPAAAPLPAAPGVGAGVLLAAAGVPELWGTPKLKVGAAAALSVLSLPLLPAPKPPKVGVLLPGVAVSLPGAARPAAGVPNVNPAPQPGLVWLEGVPAGVSAVAFDAGVPKVYAAASPSLAALSAAAVATGVPNPLPATPKAKPPLLLGVLAAVSAPLSSPAAAAGVPNKLLPDWLAGVAAGVPALDAGGSLNWGVGISLPLGVPAS